MRRIFFKRISSIVLFLLFVFGLNIASFSQSLDPLETQPSDFGEMKKNIPSPKESLDPMNEGEKAMTSEMEAFIAQAKRLVLEKSEIRSAERQ